MNLNPKVSAAALAGAASLLICFLLVQLGVAVTPEIASALTLVLTVLAGYLKSANDWHPK